MTTKYKATLKYVGTRYAGWQIQKNQKTIQGQLRDALSTVAGQPVTCRSGSVERLGPTTYVVPQI